MRIDVLLFALALLCVMPARAQSSQPEQSPSSEAQSSSRPEEAAEGTIGCASGVPLHPKFDIHPNHDAGKSSRSGGEGR